MKFYVYILRSKKNNKTYIGHTQNLSARIKQHNAGETKSTKANIPYELIFYEVCATRSVAVAKEKYFKSGVGREYIKANIINAPVVQLDRISDFGSEG